MVVPGAATMGPQQPKLVRQGLVVGRHATGVAGGAEILRRIEAETSRTAPRAGAATRPAGADGLGRVLQDGDAVPIRH